MREARLAYYDLQQVVLPPLGPLSFISLREVLRKGTNSQQAAMADEARLLLPGSPW